MLKDPTEFRKRFIAWKETGESLYDAGIPKYNGGKSNNRSLLNYIDRATRYIAQHEGFVDHVYEDTVANQDYAKKYGYWSDKHLKYVLPTAGYGWTAKKDLRKWTKEEADTRLREDVVKYDNYWRKKIPGWDALKDEHKMAIIDLGHQGGLGVLDKMPKFKAAIMSGDKNAGRYISYASSQTPTRNNDRIALWNSPELYKREEIKLLSKLVANEMVGHIEQPNRIIHKKPILPIDRTFDSEVPKSISLQNTFDTPAQKAIKALDNQIALNKLIKAISIENINPWNNPQIEDIMAGQLFTKLTMPQIIGH